MKYIGSVLHVLPVFFLFDVCGIGWTSRGDVEQTFCRNLNVSQLSEAGQHVLVTTVFAPYLDLRQGELAGESPDGVMCL